MAIIISYPGAKNVSVIDTLLGTQYDPEVGGNVTRNFPISSIVNLALATFVTEGATGSFTTSDLKLVTVVNGLITDIAFIG
jgi:hypothetical protein